MKHYDVAETIDICEDCLVLTSGSRDTTPAHRDAVNRKWPETEWRIEPGCPADCEWCADRDDGCEPSFSWLSCEGCGSTLGGNRYPAVVFDF